MTAREITQLAVLWDDAITEVSGVAIHGHSAEDSEHPAENLLDDDRQSLYKTTASSGSVQVSFDLGSAQGIKGWAILNHNSLDVGADSIYIYSSDNGSDWTQRHSWVVSSLIGNDDFFDIFPITYTYRYWRILATSVDSAGWYLGRLYLARERKDFNSILRLGSSLYYAHKEEVRLSPTGIEKRRDMGAVSRGIRGETLPMSASNKEVWEDIINWSKVNHKPFITSIPFGTVAGFTNYFYGAAIHSVFAGNAVEFRPPIGQRYALPLETREVL